MPRKKKPRNNARDVLNNALDTPAINYWAEVRNVKNDPKSGDVISFEVRDCDPDGTGRVKTRWTLIDEKAVNTAAQAFLAGDIDVRRDIAAQFIGKEWELDSEGTDCAVQAACYGKLVFG